MDQRLTMISLGVEDLAASTAFYERLGWQRSLKELPGISFFQCGCMVVGLYPRTELAKDAGVPAERSGFPGFAIAYNTRSREEVDATLAEAVAAGAEIVKPAQDVFWGGYSGYFRDPDGHLWEVAWNKDLVPDAEGAVKLPD